MFDISGPSASTVRLTVLVTPSTVMVSTSPCRAGIWPRIMSASAHVSSVAPTLVWSANSLMLALLFSLPDTTTSKKFTSQESPASSR